MRLAILKKQLLFASLPRQSKLMCVANASQVHSHPAFQLIILPREQANKPVMHHEP